MGETGRQLVHLFGLVFVLLSIVVDKLLISAYFFMVASFFLLYSYFVRRQRNILMRVVDRLESGLRGFANSFEREAAAVPYAGAFWFYFSCGLTLLIFPLHVALVSCSILAVADCASTVIGTRYGTQKTIGNKTLEGSVAFFVSAFVVAFMFINFWAALLAAFTSTVAELLPDAGPLGSLRRREFVNDNFTVPLITALLLVFIL